jgi:CheY-like chemotaxis protein
VKLVSESIRSDVPYCAVFMDNIMPNMAGPEAASAMRDLGYRNPIIGVTGNALEEDKISFLKAGADSVLIKPINTHSLQHILQSEFFIPTSQSQSVLDLPLYTVNQDSNV